MVEGAVDATRTRASAHHLRSGGNHEVVIVHVASGRRHCMARAPEAIPPATRIFRHRSDLRSIPTLEIPTPRRPAEPWGSDTRSRYLGILGRPRASRARGRALKDSQSPASRAQTYIRPGSDPSSDQLTRIRMTSHSSASAKPSAAFHSPCFMYRSKLNRSSCFCRGSFHGVTLGTNAGTFAWYAG